MPLGRLNPWFKIRSGKAKKRRDLLFTSRKKELFGEFLRPLNPFLFKNANYIVLEDEAGGKKLFLFLPENRRKGNRVKAATFLQLIEFEELKEFFLLGEGRC